MNIVFSLCAGLIIAATVQLMLTNLGIALGLTVLDWSPQSKPPPPESTPPNPSSEQTLPITSLIGFGVAVSVSLVLFTASLLTVEFGQIAEPRRGAIFGIILWATYWLLVAWLSSTTLSSIANSVLGTAIAGLRRLIDTLRQSINSRSPVADIDQTLLRELAVEMSQMADFQETLPKLLAQQREQLIEEISDRTNLSPTEAASVVDELDTKPSPSSGLDFSTQSSSLLTQLDLPNWQQILQQILNQVDLSDLDVETLWQQWQAMSDSPQAAPDTFDVEGVEAAILLDAEDFVRQAPHWSFHPEVLAETFYERLYDPEADPEQIHEQLGSINRVQFIDWLEARGDLAAERLEAIADQLDQVRQSVIAKASPATATDLQPAIAAAQAKLIAYCRYTNLDVLTPASLLEKIETVRAEEGLPQQLPAAVKAQMDWSSLDDILTRRQGISSEQQQALAAALQTVRQTEAAVEAGKADPALQQRLRDALEKSLHAVDWSAVTLEDLKPELLNQLRALDLRGELDWAALGNHLQVPKEVKAELTDWLQNAGKRLSKAPRRWAKRAGQSVQSWLQQLTRQIAHYLQFQEKSAFQPEQMAQDVAQIVKGAVRAFPSPSDLPDWSDLSRALDLSSLRPALEHRRDMTVEDVHQVLDSLEAAWSKTVHQMNALPQALWSEAQAIARSELDDLDALRQQVVDRIVSAQAAVQTRVTAAKADLQRQADATRKQVAIAAWWLFFSLLASGGAAAIAGWLAVQY